jgi:hypothetical protein
MMVDKAGMNSFSAFSRSIDRERRALNPRGEPHESA